MKTMTYSHINGQRSGRQGGFSLVEVLIAMGIFAVGFVAVAAMFPAGAMLQKETVAAVESQLVARNAAAIMRSTRITFNEAGLANADLDKNSGQPGNLEPIATMATVKNAKLKTRWTLGDRGYPTAQQTTNDRKYYWLPFIHRHSQEVDTADPSKKKYSPAVEAGDFNLMVFVLRREGGMKYEHKAGGLLNGTSPAGLVWANTADGVDIPKVVGITPTSAAAGRFNFNNRLFPTTPAGVADQVRAGDHIADNNGVIYLVSDANATGCDIVGGIRPTPTGGTLKMWFAPPPGPGTSSPCTRIVLLSGLVTQVP